MSTAFALAPAQRPSLMRLPVMMPTGDAFYLTGRAVLVDDSALRERLSAQFVAERLAFNAPPPADDHLLFELQVEGCMLTRTNGHGGPAAQHTVWASPS